MKTITQPAIAQDKLLALSHAICTKTDRQNEEEQLFADLTGLFVEIIREIAQKDSDKVSLIFDYAKLLEWELSRQTGPEAYIMGYEAKDMPINELLKSYLLKRQDDKHRSEICIQNCFNEISVLLSGKVGLLTDFTEVFRTVHGAISNNIHKFIELGQNQRRTEEGA